MTKRLGISLSEERIYQTCRTDWPLSKRFAFTVIDDTDGATLENVKPVYELLLALGIHTTKTVWPLVSTETEPEEGSSLENVPYLEWVRAIKRQGVEIGIHGAASRSSDRLRSQESLNRFHSLMGHYPQVYTIHVGQQEGIYWGEDRLSGSARWLYKIIHRLKGHDRAYSGHKSNSPYFWGDICQERITYVRNLVFSDVNTLKMDPAMPYHDPRRPYVRYWFSASDGADVNCFCRLLSASNQDRLLESGGACIVYTHFASGFVENGRLHAEFKRLMERLAGLPGWFVPVSTLLDHLRSRPGWKETADPRYLTRLEWRWLLQKLLTGTS